MSRLRRGVCILFVLMFAVPLPASSSTPVPVTVTPSGAVTFPEGGGTRVLDLTVPSDGLVKGTVLSVNGTPAYVNRTWSATAEELWTGAQARENLTLRPDGISLGGYGSWWEEDAPDLGFGAGIDSVSVLSPVLNVSAHSRVVVEGRFPSGSTYAVDVLDPMSGNATVEGGLKNGEELPGSLWSGREQPYRDLVLRLDASRAFAESTPEVRKWGVGTGWHAGPEATSWSGGDAIVDGGQVELGHQALWTEMSPPFAPTGRIGTDLVYSPRDGTVLMWAGQTDFWVFPTEMYSYSPGADAWTDITPATVPPGRWEEIMAYDTLRNRAYMFAGAFETAAQCRDDMWEYDPGLNTWTQLFPANPPTGRWAHSMAYDPKYDVVVLYGGCEKGTLINLGDTWLYYPATNRWVKQDPAASPPVRCASNMVYDEDDGVVLLFGGYEDTTYYDDLWAYDVGANTWSPRHPSTRPPTRTDACMVYDTALDEAVLFSGTMGPTGTLLNDTWAYNYTRDEWVNLTTPSSPPTRGLAEMAYVPDLGLSVMYGGTYGASTYYSDTWTLRVRHLARSHVLTPPLAPILDAYGSILIDATLPAGTGYWVNVTDEVGVVLYPYLRNGNPVLVDATEHPAIRLDLTLWTDDGNVTPVVRGWGLGTSVTGGMDLGGASTVSQGLEASEGLRLQRGNTEFLNWSKEEGIRLDNSTTGSDAILDGDFDIIQIQNGSLRMYYTGYDPSVDKCRILSAISRNGLDWSKEDGVRVDIGGGSIFEERVVSNPRIFLLSNGTFRMFYTCSNDDEGVPAFTASAFSKDGLAWTKEGLRLVPGGRADGYDNARAYGGWVEPYPGGYRVFYVGLDVNYGKHRILSATSPDTLTWTKEGGVRVDIGTTADFEDDTVCYPVITRLANGTYRMFYSCGNEGGGARIRSALSQNLIDWTKEPGVRISPGGPNDANDVLAGGRIFPVAGGFRQYYLGGSGSGDGNQILSAVSSFDYRPAGSLVSSASLANTPSSLRVSWNGSTPADTSLAVSIRISPDGLNFSPWTDIPRGAMLTRADHAGWGQYLEYNITLTTSDPDATPSIRDLRIYYMPCLPGPAILEGLAIGTPDGEIVAAHPMPMASIPAGTSLELSLSADDGTLWQTCPPGEWTSFASSGPTLRWRVGFMGDGNATALLRGIGMDYTLECLPTDVAVDVGADGSVEWHHDGVLDTVTATSGLTDALNAYISAHRLDSLGDVLLVPVAVTSATGGTIELSDTAVDFAPSPHVVAHGPVGTGVPLNASVSVSFDAGIEMESLVLSIVPPLNHALEWTEGQTGLNVLHSGLEQNTTYVVTIGAGGLSLEGAPLLAGFSWNFTTLAINPRVIEHGPTGTGVPLDAPVSLLFDEPMSVGSVDVEITPPVPLEPVWATGGRGASLTHPKFRQNTTYTVTVRAGALSTHGARLVDDLSWSFTTKAVNLSILAHAPSGTDIPLDMHIVLVFDDSVDIGSVRLTILPPLDLEQEWSSNSSLMVLHHAPFREGTTYTVTVEAGALSVHGAPLLLDHFWSFTTMEKTANATSVGESGPDAIVLAIVVSFIIIVGLGAYASTEYGGFSLMTLMLPLYARMRKEAILDNKTRFALHGIIIENPGIHYHALAKQLDISNGAAIYHLSVLEREGYIKARRDGVLKRFYSDTAKVPDGHKSSPEDLRLQIVRLVANEPGLTQKAVSERMGINRDIIGYHLRALVKEGSLTASREGKFTVYHPPQNKRDIR